MSDAFADDDTVDGILVQHPMPPQVDERLVFEAITDAKDVDGVTGSSFAAMALGNRGFRSCTPGGIMYLIDAYDVDPAGQRAVKAAASARRRAECGPATGRTAAPPRHGRARVTRSWPGSRRSSLNEWTSE